MRSGLTILALEYILLALGCGEYPRESRSPDIREAVDNLLMAGFPADDITVVAGRVYVGGDAEVPLAASREMLQVSDDSMEQYRTNNIVNTSVTKICINGSTFTGLFSTGLDLAIQNYNQLGLGFTMARTPSGGCSFTINAVIDSGRNGGVSGFPSSGLPFGTIHIGDAITPLNADLIEHVTTHELGHTIGLRHSDYFNRSISCGSGGNEGAGDDGAILIPGTDPGATVGGSLMNSCFRSNETGEFTASDIVALKALYAPTCSSAACIRECSGKGFCEGRCRTFAICGCSGHPPCP